MKLGAELHRVILYKDNVNCEWSLASSRIIDDYFQSIFCNVYERSKIEEMTERIPPLPTPRPFHLII